MFQIYPCMINKNKKEIIDEYHTRFIQYNNISNYYIELHTSTNDKEIFLCINSKEVKLLFNI